ncbi:MAG: hypothetical protein QG604_927 [Candidatus Dependentiae bacterium]|nr:hypothetical protein [Candidatus Dependentiae bacterium]
MKKISVLLLVMLITLPNVAFMASDEIEPAIFINPAIEEIIEADRIAASEAASRAEREAYLRAEKITQERKAASQARTVKQQRNARIRNAILATALAAGSIFALHKWLNNSSNQANSAALAARKQGAEETNPPRSSDEPATLKKDTAILPAAAVEAAAARKNLAALEQERLAASKERIGLLDHQIKHTRTYIEALSHVYEPEALEHIKNEKHGLIQFFTRDGHAFKREITLSHLSEPIIREVPVDEEGDSLPTA